MLIQNVTVQVSSVMQSLLPWAVKLLRAWVQALNVLQKIRAHASQWLLAQQLLLVWQLLPCLLAVLLTVV